jgi:lantibiotic leader peptide-processing serine protease
LRKILPYSVFALIMLLLVSVQTASADENGENYYTVLVKEAKWEEAVNHIEKNGGEIVYEVKEIGLIQIKADRLEAERISYSSYIDAYNPSVRAAAPPMEASASSLPASLPELWDFQWDMQAVTNNGQSYSLYSGSKNVTVGIIDSGITQSHPDLLSSIVQGSKNLVPAGGFRGEEAYETGDISQISDLTGHGTFIAGQIAANGLSKGIAPDIGIKSYRVFGGSSADSAWIIKAIIEAAKDDVDVINLSLGDYLIKGVTYTFDGKSKQDLAEIKAYEKAINFAHKQGTAVVSAVGNDHLNVSDKKEMDAFMKELLAEEGISFKGRGIDVPAGLPHVVTVSSTGPTEELSIFSNYGKGFVDIAAPGGDLRLLEEYGPDAWMNELHFQKEMIMGPAINGAYTFNAGTSLAAPKVSGALALIIDKYGYRDKPDRAIHHLYSHGIRNTKKKDRHYYGHGVLDIFNALSK